MEYVYPAIFDPNDDGSFTITYPDLPGCISEGKTLPNAMFMAQDALAQWLGYLLDKKQIIPTASDIKKINPSGDKFVSLVWVNLSEKKLA